jgi:hypothetical protein
MFGPRKGLSKVPGALKYLLLLRHWGTRYSLLKGKVQVVTGLDVCNMRGWVAMMQKIHPLRHHDAGIVGNHAQSQLAKAVISVKVTIFYLGFFVESLAELKGTRKRRCSNKKFIEKTLALSTYLADSISPDSTCGVHLEPTTVRKTAILSKELTIALVAVDKFLVWVRKSMHQLIEMVWA